MRKTQIRFPDPYVPTPILVVQTAFLGDVILTLPLIKAIRERFPHARLDFLTIPASKNIAETLPYIQQLWLYDKHGKEKGIVPLIRLIRRLRHGKYDLAFVPHRSLRSALLVTAAGIRIRIGFHNSAGKYLFSHLVPYHKGMHEVERNLQLLNPLGGAPEGKPYPELFFTPRDHATVSDWLRRQGIGGEQPFVTLAPGSVWATKRWPAAYYSALAQRLYAHGIVSILVGGPLDQDLADRIQHRAGPAVRNAVGQMSLRQSALLIQQSKMLVTNDSAPLHLGVAVRIPVVAIFGPTVPAFGFYPWGPHDQVIERKELDCRPCGIHGGHRCPVGTHECMLELKPERVFMSVLTKLKELGVIPSHREQP